MAKKSKPPEEPEAAEAAEAPPEESPPVVDDAPEAAPDAAVIVDEPEVAPQAPEAPAPEVPAEPAKEAAVTPPDEGPSEAERVADIYARVSRGELVVAHPWSAKNGGAQRASITDDLLAYAFPTDKGLYSARVGAQSAEKDASLDEMKSWCDAILRARGVLFLPERPVKAKG